MVQGLIYIIDVMKSNDTDSSMTFSVPFVDMDLVHKVEVLR